MENIGAGIGDGRAGKVKTSVWGKRLVNLHVGRGQHSEREAAVVDDGVVHHGGIHPREGCGDLRHVRTDTEAVAVVGMPLADAIVVGDSVAVNPGNDGIE